MIIYSKLGTKGNLGNQLFQIASTIGIAVSNNQLYGFPSWKYNQYFMHKLPVYTSGKNYKPIKESRFEYQNYNLQNGDFDLMGWFQTEKYFDIEKTQFYFTFKPEIIDFLRTKYKKELSNKNILISVRRGDFVNNPQFYQLSYRYYTLALIHNFPDWQQRTIFFTSDDIQYCKYHFGFLKNAFFIENLEPIKQLAFSTLCDDFIISNSTFSWWQAWLAQSTNKRIIRPIKNFRGKFSEENDDKDYFPVNWEIFNHKEYDLGFKFSKLILKGEVYRILLFLKQKLKYYKYRLGKKVKAILFFGVKNR